MHVGRIILGGLLIAGSGAAAASADYFLQIKSVGRDAATGPIYLQATGDLDGDGAMDEAVVRLDCAGATLRSADYQVHAPRDVATGQSTGKRTHKPLKIIKEWGPATPQLMKMRPTYDVKKVEGTGARKMPVDDWQAISLANADGLCPAAEAAVRATRSRSNIQNN